MKKQLISCFVSAELCRWEDERCLLKIQIILLFQSTAVQRQVTILLTDWWSFRKSKSHSNFWNPSRILGLHSKTKTSISILEKRELLYWKSNPKLVSPEVMKLIAIKVQIYVHCYKWQGLGGMLQRSQESWDPVSSAVQFYCFGQIILLF